MIVNSFVLNLLQLSVGSNRCNTGARHRGKHPMQDSMATVLDNKVVVNVTIAECFSMRCNAIQI